MKLICKFLVRALHSKISFLIVLTFCVGSFFLGQRQNDMNLFAASGGVMTIFGLLSTIRFSTLEKYLNKDTLVAQSTGITGPPLRDGELEELIIKKQARGRGSTYKRTESRTSRNRLYFVRDADMGIWNLCSDSSLSTGNSVLSEHRLLADSYRPNSTTKKDFPSREVLFF